MRSDPAAAQHITGWENHRRMEKYCWFGQARRAGLVFIRTRPRRYANATLRCSGAGSRCSLMQDCRISHAIRRILVAIKDPRVAEYARRKRPQLARCLNAELSLYHALTGPLYVESASASREPLVQAQEPTRTAVKTQLERMAEPLRTANLSVRVEASWDYPAHDKQSPAYAFASDLYTLWGGS